MGNYKLDSLFTDSFAYDLSKNPLSEGEIFDYDVINQSIEMILSTIRGERLFLPQLGSVLPLVIFENINETNGDETLDLILQAIELWEDRIILDKENAELIIVSDMNTIDLIIPYRLNNTNITNTFRRTIIL